jgi:hypothetical protein
VKIIEGGYEQGYEQEKLLPTFIQIGIYFEISFHNKYNQTFADKHFS